MSKSVPEQWFLYLWNGRVQKWCFEHDNDLWLYEPITFGANGHEEFVSMQTPPRAIKQVLLEFAFYPGKFIPCKHETTIAEARALLEGE